MSGGGKKQTTTEVRDPWGPALPYLTDSLNRVGQAASQPASYFPGPLTVGPTQAEQGAWNRQFNYNTQTFGDSPQLNFGDTANAYQRQLSGGAYGSMAPVFGGAARAVSGGPAQIGRYGFGTNLDVGGNAPTYGLSEGLDARPALQRMLSGTPDYAGAQRAVDAANAPILRSLQQDVIPGLNERATFLNNGTGGVKALNRVLPDVAERMSRNAGSIMEGERQRALAEQMQAAQMVGQGGLQAYGQGLQTALGEAGLGQDLAGFNLATDQARAGALGDWRQQMLGLGGLGANYAGGANAATGNALNQSPSLYGLAQAPQDDLNRYAAWDRGLQEQQLGAEQQRFNYLRDYPQNQAGWYASMVQPFGQQGGTNTTTTRQQSSMGFGDLLSAGIGLGSMFLPGVGPMLSQGIMGAMAPNIMGAANNALQPYSPMNGWRR